MARRRRAPLRGRRRLQQVPGDALGAVRRGAGLGGFVAGAYRAAPFVRAAARGIVDAYRLNRSVAAANRSVAARNRVIKEKRGKRSLPTPPPFPRKRGYGSMEKSRTASSYGRKKPLQTMKVMKMSVPRLVLTCQGLKTDDKALSVSELPGYFKMSNTLANVNGASETFGVVPVVVASLNGTWQNNTGAEPLRYVQLHNTGRVEFPIIAFQDNTSTSAVTNSWNVEASSTGGEKSGMCSRIVNEWIAARFVFYGAKTQQTTWRVHLVQASHDLAAVEEEDALLAAGGTHGDRYRDMVYGWWQNLIRPLVTTDIALKLNPSKPRMNTTAAFRVLRTWSYDIAPHTQIETDTTPNSVVAKIFINDHRTLNYQWTAPGLAYDATRTSTTQGMDDLAWVPQWQNFQSDAASGYLPVVQPAPKARRYLIVTCNNTTPVANNVTPVPAETPDNTPSFNMVLRKCELRGPNFAV